MILSLLDMYVKHVNITCICFSTYRQYCRDNGIKVLRYAYKILTLGHLIIQCTIVSLVIISMFIVLLHESLGTSVIMVAAYKLFLISITGMWREQCPMQFRSFFFALMYQQLIYKSILIECTNGAIRLGLPLTTITRATTAPPGVEAPPPYFWCNNSPRIEDNCYPSRV